MDFRIARAGRGLQWFQGAIRMLDKNPRGLLAVSLAFALIQQVPNLAAAAPALLNTLSVLLVLFSPTLAAGVMHAIAEADAGRPVAITQLFEGARRRGVRGQLLVLGVLWLLALLLIVGAVLSFIGADNIAIIMKVAEKKLAPDSPEFLQLAGPLLKTAMIAVVILFVLLSGLFFAVPRVMFDGRSALGAFAESIAACAANMLSLTVYGLVAIAACMALGLGLAIVVGVLGLLGKLGALLLSAVMLGVTAVVLLVSASGNYLAWREVFGHADPDASQPQAGIVV